MVEFDKVGESLKKPIGSPFATRRAPDVNPAWERWVFPARLSGVKSTWLSEPDVLSVAQSIAQAKRLRNATGPQAPSFVQEGLWFLHQKEPNLVAFNVPLLFRIKGNVDREALRRALEVIVNRHESLRTNFVLQDGTLSAIVRPAEIFELPVIPVADGESEMEELARSATKVTFDLATDLLLRARLFQTTLQESFLLLVVHHICWDDRSLHVLLKELCCAYDSFAQGKSCRLPELPLQYSDFAFWERRQQTEQRVQEEMEYWGTELAGVPNAPLLFPDRPRSARQTYNGRRHVLRLAPELTAELKEFNRREHVTLFMTTLATLAALLHRLTNQQDIVIGYPITSRTTEDLESVIGLFNNTLAVRCRFDADPTFNEVLGRVRLKSIEAMEHGELPFPKLVQALHPDRSLSHTPFYQVVLSTDITQVGRRLSGELEIEQMQFDAQTASFDLTVYADFSKEPLLVFNYNSDLFDQTTIERMARYFSSLLRACLRSPGQRVSQMTLIDASERLSLLEWSQNKKAYRRECVHTVIEDLAARAPSQPALLWDDEQLSYGELNRRANRIAQVLLAAGVQTGERIGLLLSRSFDLVVSMLGVLKAGAAYVAINPDFPQKRIDFIGENCGIRVVLVSKKSAHLAPARSEAVIGLGEFDYGTECIPNPHVLVAADAPAYCLHTSGSTGEPKGVEVPHRGITRLVFAQDYAHFGPEEVFLHLSSITFDASTLEIWAPLLHGGRCALYTGTRLDAEQIGAAIRQYGVTSMWLTASLFNLIIEESPDTLTLLHQLLVGGEALSVPHIRKGLRALPFTQIINGYGPTENTTFTTCYRIPRGLPQSLSSIPIGQPISNSECYIFDSNRSLCPIGVPGELYAGGDGLALRYVNSEEMTAEKFVDVPLDGQTKRLYKTGDICRWLADGNIEFLGRRDEQVKIRGLRIELGEIESALSTHPSVSAAAVCVVGDGADKRLAAYTVQRTALQPRLLRDYLRQQLPDYMVPAHYVSIDQLPLTASGKVDRSVLPPVPHSKEADGPGAPVNPELRRKVAEIWKAVLGVNSAREDQDFFDLGGHSLLATKMIARVERDLGVSLPVTSCFEHSTLGELADVVAASARPGSSRYSNHFVKRLLWIGGGAFVRHIKPVLQPEAEFVPVGLDLSQWASFQAPYHLSAIARAYAETIISRYSEGPHMLGGHCYEGVLAFETAQQLRALGSQVDLVVVVDAQTPLSRFGMSRGQRMTARLQKELFHVSSLARTSVTEWVPYLYGRLETLMADRRRRSWEIEESNFQGIDGESEVARIIHLAMIKYKPAPYGGRFVFFQAQDRPRGWYWDLAPEWRPLVGEHGEFHEIPGNHMSILTTPNVTVFAERLKRAVMQMSPSAVT